MPLRIAAGQKCIRVRVLTGQDFAPEALHVLRDIAEDVRGKNALE